MQYLSLPQALVLLLIVFGSSTKQICYVKPNDSSVTCPGYSEPCLTLDQYTQQTTHQCFSTGSTLLFLPGNHTLHSKVQLENVSDILFSREGGKSDVLIAVTDLGAIHCENVANLKIQDIAFHVLKPKGNLKSSFLIIINGRDVLLYNLTFQGGKAVHCSHSNAWMVSCLFKENIGHNGGAVSMTNNNNITLEGTTFIGNKAMIFGGAIYVVHSSLILLDTHFINNSAQFGGAMYLENSKINIVNDDPTRSLIPPVPSQTGYTNAFQSTTTTFAYNNAMYRGGAIYFVDSEAILNGTVTNFQNNHAFEGGAITMIGTTLLLGGEVANFVSNSAIRSAGGIIVVDLSRLHITAKEIHFLNNTATNLPTHPTNGSGGGLCVISSEVQVIQTVSHFINNTAYQGGAIFLYSGNMTYHNLNCIGNSGSALFMMESTVRFHDLRVADNVGEIGAGMNAWHSSVFFSGSTVFKRNTAYVSGGAISAEINTNLSFIGIIAFTNNRASVHGGAIEGTGYARISISGYCLFLNNTAEYGFGGAIDGCKRTSIILGHYVNFTSNKARSGGAMHFCFEGTLTLKQNVTVISSNNYASMYGGFLMNDDSITFYQCHYRKAKQDPEFYLFLPFCFMLLEGLVLNSNESFYSIHSTDDSAGIDGSFIYGGLLDKCKVFSRIQQKRFLLYTDQWDILWTIVMERHVFNIQRRSNATTKEISSGAYTLCFCESQLKYNCFKQKRIAVYKGQEFSVPLLALSQGDYAISTLVTSILNPTARLGLDQSVPAVHEVCTELKFNLYSTRRDETLRLFTNSLCRDTGLALAIVNVNFLSCPKAFIPYDDQCVCEKRLQAYQAKCTIYNGEDEIFILRTAEQDFWVSALYLNLSYEGLILCRTCPVQYCKTKAVNITLDNPDIQCGLNRSGVLCGGCAANYSLLLGSSRCEACYNSYLGLLLVFAVAGIVLVVSLSFLRLTVASGMINTVILYANIVQANRRLFFPNSTNILTVFIAWMNLDLGFETCFYRGMDAYAQTWLQFAFPVYVWFLISLIIVASRYSIFLTKLIGSNPIAVLATLLLMSYTKILKIAIEVYTFGKLDYPDNKTVTVWLKDANVPYLQTWHLFLTVVTSLILVFLFLPYTLFLLLGYKLYRFSGRRHLRWLNKLKPLLDSYYAPYEKRTRYWTGFLLLIRCVLYIVFSLDSLVVSTRSIIITFTALTVIAWLSVRIYKKYHANAIEASVYLNLIVLAVFTTNSPAVWLVYPLVTVVFVTMIGIVVYHLHSIHIAKSTVWLNVKAKAKYKCRFMESTQDRNILPIPTGISSHDPHKIISKTVICLREPLLEN